MHIFIYIDIIILRINNETSKSTSNFLLCQYICKGGICVSTHIRFPHFMLNLGPV